MERKNGGKGYKVDDDEEVEQSDTGGRPLIVNRIHLVTNANCNFIKI